MEKAMSKLLRVLLTVGVLGVVVAAGGCQKGPPAVAKVSPEEAQLVATPTPAVKAPDEKPAVSGVNPGEAEPRTKGAPPAYSKPPVNDRVAASPPRRSEPVIRPRAVHEVITIPEGTSLKVQAVDSLGSARNQVGDTFRLRLDQSLSVNGLTVANTGSEVTGRVTRAKEGGKVKGRAEIGFMLVELKTALGKRYPIVTEEFYAQAEGSKKRDALTIGGGAGVGAAIGGIIGDLYIAVGGIGDPPYSISWTRHGNRWLRGNEDRQTPPDSYITDITEVPAF